MYINGDNIVVTGYSVQSDFKYPGLSKQALVPFILVHTYPSTPTAKLSFIPSTAKPVLPSELHCILWSPGTLAVHLIACTSSPAWHLGCIYCVSLIPPGTSVSAEEYRGRALLLSVLLLCPVSYEPSSGAKEALLPEENISVPWEVDLSHSERPQE